MGPAPAFGAPSERRAAPRPEVRPGTLLVRFRAGAPRDAVLARRHLRHERRVPRLGIELVSGARDPEAAARALERDPAVVFAEPDYVRRASAVPDDPLYAKGRLGYIDTLRLPAAWDLSRAGADQRVAVLDTGVHASHPDLAGRVLAGRDFVNGDAVANDDAGHGTQVAGIAAALADDGVGTAGVAWAASIVPVKVLDSAGEGFDSDIAAGIAWAADQSVDVINLSLGAPGESAALEQAIDYARGRGVVVVASAGNDASAVPNFPAAAPGVLGVAASDWAGNPAWFTNHGDWVDLTAPGYDMFAPSVPDVHESVEGTSFSAPVVSGVALLLAALHPSWTGDQIAARLTATALDIGPAGHDPHHGAGLVDPVAALGGPAAPRSSPPPADLNGTPDRATTLTLGVNARGAIEVPGDEDWYAVNVTTPTYVSPTLYADASRLSGRAEAFDAVIDVYDPQLRLLEHIDYPGNEAPEIFGRASLTQPGRYYFRVRNFNASRSVGGYELGVFGLGTPGPRDPFEPLALYRAEHEASSVALGDVTGDGRTDTLMTVVDPDLIANDDELWVFAGNAQGALDPPVALPAPGTSGALGIAVADFDGDGADDVVVAGGGSFLLYRQQAGGLAPARPIAAGGHVGVIEAADVDGDGRTDLVAAARGSLSRSGVVFYRNTGTGFERRLLMDGLPSDVAVGDVNGDGRLDVVGAYFANLFVLRQAADGTFGQEAVPARTVDVELADVTGDGRVDAITSEDPDGPGGYSVVLRPQLAAGGFGAPQVVDSDTIISNALDAGDLDGDGRDDVAVVGSDWGALYYQQPGGGLGPRQGRDLPQGYTYTGGVAIGDANGDGAGDLSYANNNVGLVVLRGRSATWPAPAVAVRDTAPADGANGVPSAVVPEIRFTGPASATARLERADTGAQVAAAVTVNGAVLRVQPTAALAPGGYRLRVDGDVVLRFTVGAAPDGGPPDTVILSAPSGTVKEQDPRFWAYATEPGARLQCAIDSGAFAPCPDPIEPGSQLAGTRTFRVRAVDGAGTPDPSPATRTWRGDEQVTSPPNDGLPGTELAGPSGSVSGSTAGATEDPFCDVITRDSPGAQSIWYRWTAPADGWATFDTAGSSFDTLLGVFSEGCRDEHRRGESDDAPGRRTSRARLRVRAGVTYSIAVDGYSREGVNAENGAVTLAWSFETSADGVPPETTITGGPAAMTTSMNAGFTFASSEPGSTFECNVNGNGGWQPCASPYALRPFLGDHTLLVRATDPAGNTDPSPAAWTWRTDWLRPETVVRSGPIGIVATTDATLTFADMESEAVAFECRLDGGAWATCASPARYSGLADGAHRFGVRAIDAAGNVDLSPAVRAWVIDRGGGDVRAPQTFITELPPAVSASRTARFEFEADEPDGGTFECRLDLGAWTACASPTTYEGLADGQHRFDVRAIDAAGNVDTEPPDYTWRVEAAPSTAITGRPDALTRETSATFEFGSPQAVTFECRFDGGAWAGCSSPTTYSGLADGEHRFAARAVDAAGRRDPSPPEVVWRVDTVAPATALTAQTEGDAATFTFSSEPGAAFSCRLDAAAWAPCGSPAAYDGLGAGEHRFAVRAADAAGNVEDPPREHVWTVDDPTDPTDPTDPDPTDPTDPTDPDPPGSPPPDPPPPPTPDPPRGDPPPPARLTADLGRLPALRTALRRGLRVTVRCPAACRITARLTARGEVLARARGRLAAAGRLRLELEFTARARRTLRGSRRLRAKLEVREAGRLSLTRTVRLSRTA